MDKSLKDKAYEVHEWLINQEVVKEYKRYELAIKNNTELAFQEEELKKIQKEIVNKKHNNEECEELINKYELLKEQFFNHPIVHNYLLLKEEVNQLIQQINGIINQNINQ